MAKSKDNVVMHGASGTIGKMLVFRKKGDKTIIANRPTYKQPRKSTENQILARENFEDAAYYAKSVIKDEAIKTAYEARAEGNQTAYNVAIKDYLTPPEVRRVIANNYAGAIGDTITFRLIDVFVVQSVRVQLHDGAGQLIEEGAATIAEADSMEWVYTAQAQNDSVEGSTVTLTIIDTPGNTVEQTVAL